MAKRPMTTKDKIREWISDNLRYMILGLAILIVVGLIVLVVYLLSARSVSTANSNSAAKQQSADVSEESLSAESKSVVTASSTSGSKSSETTAAASASTQSTTKADSTVTASASQADAASGGVQTFAENNVPDVSSVCTSYFQALGSKDVDTLRSLVDSLSDEDAAIITENSDVADYRDISVYTIAGPNEGSYIAFVRYTCDYNGISTGLPMLGEVYVYTTDQGLRIMENADEDETIGAAMQSAQSNADVAALIEQVQTNYELALEQDPALEEKVSQLEQN